MAAAHINKEAITLTKENRYVDVLSKPKISFLSISIDSEKEYYDYSAVIIIPCGYYATQINVGSTECKIRKGYYYINDFIEWEDHWIVLS